MEGLALLLGIIFFGGWGLGVAAFARAGRARRDAEALRAEVAALRAEVGGMAGALIAAGFRPPEAASAAPLTPAPAPYLSPIHPPPAEATPDIGHVAEPPPQPADAVVGADPDAAPPPWSRAAGPRPQRNLEELITQRWASGSAPGRCCWPASS